MLYNCAKLNPQVDKFKITRTKNKESGVDFQSPLFFLLLRKLYLALGVCVACQCMLLAKCGFDAFYCAKSCCKERQ